MRTIRSIFLILGCLHLVGGHFGALQVVAWGKMLVAYSADNGLVAGITQTFDGQHPCELCCSIRELQQQEKKGSPLGTLAERMELKHLVPIHCAAAPGARTSEVAVPGLLPPILRSDRSHGAPELPPPRQV